MDTRETPSPTTFERFAASFMSLVCEKAMEVTGASNMVELTRLLNAKLGPDNAISRNTLDNWRLGKGKAARLDAAFALLNMAQMLSIEVILVITVEYPELVEALPPYINIPQIVSHATALQSVVDAHVASQP